NRLVLDGHALAARQHREEEVLVVDPREGNIALEARLIPQIAGRQVIDVARVVLHGAHRNAVETGVGQARPDARPRKDGDRPRRAALIDGRLDLQHVRTTFRLDVERLPRVVARGDTVLEGQLSRTHHQPYRVRTCP